MGDYDVAIALRVYPGISKQPIGNYSGKFELFQISLYSLLCSLNGLRAKWYVILDGCDDNYAGWIASVIEPNDLYLERTDRVGNANTFMMQMKWLQEQDYAEKVFFAEDDYLYRPDKFPPMLNMLDNERPVIHFVSPHNHGDYYNHIIHQTTGTRLAFAHGLHWHLPVSTCLTFLTTKQVLAETSKVFGTYKSNNYDFTIFAALVKPSLLVFPPLVLLRNKFFWKSLVKAHLMTWRQLFFGRRYNLAVAIDPVATHMQYDELGPGVDWLALIEFYRKELLKGKTKIHN